MHREDRVRMTNLELPRWPGGPPICEKANLPAFATQAEALAFVASLPALSLQYLPELCQYCHGFHAYARCRPPSGGSYGVNRRK